MNKIKFNYAGIEPKLIFGLNLIRILFVANLARTCWKFRDPPPLFFSLLPIPIVLIRVPTFPGIILRSLFTRCFVIWEFTYASIYYIW